MLSIEHRDVPRVGRLHLNLQIIVAKSALVAPAAGSIYYAYMCMQIRIGITALTNIGI